MTWQPYSAETTQYILAALLVLLAPGLAWHAWSRPGRRDPLERLADIIGLSLALITVLAMLAALLNIRFSPTVMAGLGGVGIGLVMFGLVAGFITRRLRWRPRGLPLLLVGLALLGLMCAWRLYQARALLLPAWVDSVHHTLIVQKFLDVGGLPATLAPELDIVLDYHYGFHAAATLFAAASGQSAAQAVLWFGQVVNALIALSVYRLGKAFFGDWRKAAVAALLVAFVFQMPAYYVSWGRYTLSSGLVMLGPAMAAALEVSRPRAGGFGWGRLFLLTAGILLSHYLAAMLLALFLLLLGGGRLAQALLARFQARRGQPQAAGLAAQLLGQFVLLLSAVLLGVMLVLPRLWGVLQTYETNLVIRTISPQVDRLDYLKYTLNLLGPLRGHVLLGLAGAGLILANFRKAARPAALWAALMLFFTLPWGIKLGPFRPDLFAILLFFPASILLGEVIVAGADALARKLPGRWKLTAVLLAGLALAGLTAWGLKETGSVLNTSTQFVQASDLAALDWIKENTPAEARFYINVSGWQGSIYRGVDGGYWLLPLTRRAAMLPPALYSMLSREEVERLQDVAETALKTTTCSEDFWRVVRENDLTFVYIKEGTGTLQPAGLRDCPGLLNVYARDGVYLYEVLAAPGQ